MSSAEKHACARSAFRPCSLNADRYVTQHETVALYQLRYVLSLAPPDGQATLILPTLPLKQGHAANLTCFSSPSKPASVLMLYRNEQLLTTASVFYELETTSNRNRTTLTYTVDDPESSWDDALIRCEQIYTFAKNSHQAVTARLHVHCKWDLEGDQTRMRVRLDLLSLKI